MQCRSRIVIAARSTTSSVAARTVRSSPSTYRPIRGVDALKRLQVLPCLRGGLTSAERLLRFVERRELEVGELDAGSRAICADVRQ